MSREQKKFLDLSAFFQGCLVGAFILGAFWTGRGLGKIITAKKITQAKVSFFNFKPRSTKVPVPTSTPVPTSIPKTDLSKCLGLSAFPKTGGATLMVSLTGSATAGKGNKITGFEFHFGGKCVIQADCLNAKKGDEVEVCEYNKDVGDAGGHSLSCIYQSPGKYQAWVRMKDSLGSWTDVSDDCKQEIEVLGEILGETTPSLQPVTGTSTLAILGIVALLPIGVWLILI